ncbi:het domain protein [Phlyctema vagabunda]|uniref:Het domain protein n=1 Tax=Phlyctema vagabunda TaxID=108571 RepID=A0ABR4PVS2_9HELO
MDHLHTFQNAAVALPVVQYEGGEYVSTGSEAYIINVQKAIDSASADRNTNNISKLQTLLYFGMLTEVFGFIDQKSYIRHDSNNQPVLCTKRLEIDTKRWFKALKMIKDKSKRRAALEKAINCIQGVKICVEQQPSHQKVFEILTAEFIQAVQVLGASLAYAVHHFADEEKISSSSSAEDIWLVLWSQQTTWTTNKMLEAGWCPYEVERFSGVIYPLTQLCALGLQPSTIQLDHSKCTRFTCEANNISAGVYIPSHAGNCTGSTCNFLHNDVEKVKTILKEGSLPLIELRKTSDGLLELRAVKYHPGKRFVAISHVWSDGMGNKEKNEMRKCQLLRIWEKVSLLLRDNSQITLSSDNQVNLFVLGFAYLSHSTRNLLDVDKSTVTIWMDTLCIPLQPYEMRSLAIKGMRSAYEKAYKVLILDSELSCMDHTNNLETLMRIQYRSGWIRRLWTLNEGIYSQQRLFACFRNCIIRVPYIADRLMLEDDRGKIPFFTKPVAWDIYAHWTLQYRHVAWALPSNRLERAFFFDKALPLPLRITGIWLTVAGRTTTTESDRPILIMSLLGMDLSPVLSIPPSKDDNGQRCANDRMRALYKSLGEFPQAMVFQNGKRYEEYGMRWAVQVCKRDAGNGKVQRRMSGNSGRIVERGICVQFPVLLPSKIEENWSIDHGLWMKIDHLGEAFAVAALPIRGGDHNEAPLDDGARIGILIQYGKELKELLNSKIKEVTATVVSILEETNQIRYCKFIGHVELSTMPSATLRLCCDTSYISESEKIWCVG